MSEEQKQEREPSVYGSVDEKVGFGKYRDLSLIEAYETDPGYFRWAIREGAIDRTSFQTLLPYETDDLLDYDGKVAIMYTTSTMPFGKYKGDTVKSIKDEDEGYIDWLIEQDVIAISEFPGRPE